MIFLQDSCRREDLGICPISFYDCFRNQRKQANFAIELRNVKSKDIECSVKKRSLTCAGHVFCPDMLPFPLPVSTCVKWVCSEHVDCNNGCISNIMCMKNLQQNARFLRSSLNKCHCCCKKGLNRWSQLVETFVPTPYTALSQCQAGIQVAENCLWNFGRQGTCRVWWFLNFCLSKAAPFVQALCVVAMKESCLYLPSAKKVKGSK